jgi:hypothetical protein
VPEKALLYIDSCLGKDARPRKGEFLKVHLQCASCQEFLATQESKSKDGSAELITHTICPQCKIALEQKMHHINLIKLAWRVAVQSA